MSHLSQLIHALAIVKKAPVMTNAWLGDIWASKANAIAAACDEAT